jgi:hypothetical protein
MNFLYNCQGIAVAHLVQEVIYLISGKPVAYIEKTIVYSYNGFQLGTYNEGWMRDLRGACILFGEHVEGYGPIIPIRSIPPIPL